jgi:hypothetical protein
MVYVENTGQVKVNSPFGQCISKYSADERFTRYLEIGTWNGQGSTCCFYDGFTKRSTPYTLQSYEIWKDMMTAARNVWHSVPEIQIIHGRILADNECPIFSDVNAIFPNLNLQWHTEDINNFWSCPYVPMNDPQVVLLDGAEFLTYFEFQKMKDISSIKVFMLDDVHSDKCPRINQYLLDRPEEWTRVAYSDYERNGWAVFERV